MPVRPTPSIRAAVLAFVVSTVAIVGGVAPAQAAAAKPVGFAFTLVDGSAVECTWRKNTLRCLDFGAGATGATCKTGMRVAGKSIAGRKRPRSISVCATAGAGDLRTLRPGKAWKRQSVKCRVAKDASQFSCRNKTGPFVLFEASSAGPVVAPTTQCADVALAPGNATKVSATEVDCAAASALITSVAAAHDVNGGPRTFSSGDWACAVVTDGTPPVGHYGCARADAIVTWDEHSS